MDKTNKNNLSLPQQNVSLSKIFRDTWEQLVFEFYQTQKEFDKNYLKEIIKKNLSNIKKIWNSYTLDRSELKSFAFNTKEFSLSYFIGFHTANAVRIQQILTRLVSRYTINFSNISHINIFDIGCGSGAMSSSLLDFILSYLVKSNENINKDKNRDLSIRLNLMDRSSFFIKQAHLFNKKLFNQYQSLYNLDHLNLDIKDYKLSLENIGSSKIFQSIDESSLNIFIVGYVYNEIFSKKKASSVFHTIFQKNHIKKSKNLVILLDPANKTPCRNLMMFRNFMIKEPSYTPIYPCPFLKTECPMIKTSDWCYSEFIFKQDNIQKFIDHSLKIDRSHLSTTAFCFISETLLPYIEPRHSSFPTVVGKPIIKADRTQKHIQFLLCDGRKLFKKDPTTKDDALFLKGEEYAKNLKKE